MAAAKSVDEGQDNACWIPMPLSNPVNAHLPPHLREVCEILAAGLLRLRSRAAEEAARDAADWGERGLHFPPPQRLHANRTYRRPA
ncbi:hypothetical protein GCM10011504_48080 [Siccirubricoccus deserti]|nr:hypothetical protein GCM10011504_48080 [Siccirubricoccus deserti]